MEAWLRTHEVEETTRASYEQYARVHLYPAFGSVPIGEVTTQLLEEFYADLRRCAATRWAGLRGSAVASGYSSRPSN
jgi:integrase